MGDNDPGTLDRRAFLGVAAGAAALTALPAANAGAADNSEAAKAIYYGADDPQVPKVGLRWAFSATVFFNAPRIVINAPVTRGCTSVAGGEIWGPRLTGRVLPGGGADYFKGVLPGAGHSGSSGFNTYYMFEASDGALIFIHNRGTMRRFKTPEPGKPLEPAAATDPPEQVYTRFRAMPVFTAPVGPHDWMNRTVFVANAQRRANPDHTVFTYYEVL